MKILVVDDQYNATDGMPLTADIDLSDFFKGKCYNVTYGFEWEDPLPANEVLCWVPPKADTIAAFRSLFCFSSCDPDLIVLDIDFGCACDGLQLLDYIRARDKEVPVVVMSAFEGLSASERVKSAFKAGQGAANHFIAKRDLAKQPELLLQFLKPPDAYVTDRTQQKLANQINVNHNGYDLMECEHLGSLSFFVQEDYTLVNGFKQCFASELEQGDEIRILDIGCGTGRFEELFLTRFRDAIRITGIDMASGMLKTASRNPFFKPFLDDGKLTFDRGFAEHYSDRERYDFAILGFGFLSYCDARAVLTNLRRNVLKDSGIAYVSFYQYDSPYYEIWRDEINELLDLCKKLKKAEEGGTAEDTDRLEASVARVRKRLPLATTISRDLCKIYVMADRLDEFSTVPFGVNEFKRLSRSCGFSVRGDVAQHLAWLSCCDNNMLKALMHGSSGQGKPSRFDDFKARYERFYMETHGNSDENTLSGKLDLSAVEQDHTIAEKSDLLGYYSSAFLEIAQ